jgi:hypothetical protein
MPDPLSANDDRNSLAKAAIFWLLETAAAFVTAGLLSASFCLLSARLGLRLPSFTCGRRLGISFLIFLVMFWPLFVFVLPLLIPKLAVLPGRPSNNLQSDRGN